MSQLDLFGSRGHESYPHHAGFKEPGGTSEQAAFEVETVAGRLRIAVLESLTTDGPATADEIASRLGASVLSIRPRCSELFAQGKIVKTPERRTNISGKMAVVLQAKGNAQ